jgi:hypothetical protein
MASPTGFWGLLEINSKDYFTICQAFFTKKIKICYALEKICDLGRGFWGG